jgi:hypothetical protein
MATLNSAKRNVSGQLDAGEKRFVRVIDTVIDMSVDATMGTATDDINLITLPAGAIVHSVTLQQVVVGTGTGTLVGRVGATTLTGTLASTAPVGTLATILPSVFPLVVPLAGAEVNVLGATAVRTDGKVRVVITLVEGDASPKQAGIAPRDAI